MGTEDPNASSDNDGHADDPRADDERHLERPAPVSPETHETRVVNVEGRPSRAGDVHEVPHMDKVRWKLAQYLIFLLAGLIVLVFATIATARWTDIVVDDVRSIFEMMFTALVALVGSAVGFYYGSSNGQR